MATLPPQAPSRISTLTGPDPNPVARTAAKLAGGWLLLLLAGYTVGRLITDARPGVDAAVLADLQGTDHGPLTTVMRFFTDVGSPLVLNVVFLIAMSALLARRYRRAAIFLLLASPGTVLLEQIVKHTVNRARPAVHHLAAAHGPSWPSGHASSSLALYGALTLIALSIAPSRPERGRLARLTGTCLVIAVLLLIGISRIYLAVHYPTDVLAAWLIATTWLTLLSRHVAIQQPAHHPLTCGPDGPVPEPRPPSATDRLRRLPASPRRPDYPRQPGMSKRAAAPTI